MPRRRRVESNPGSISESNSQIDIQKLIDESVEKKLAGVAVDPFHCRHCFVMSDNDDTDLLCRQCRKNGNRPDQLHFAARRMGWISTAPSDLLEILRKELTEAEIWEADAETLSAIWDRETVETWPTSVEDKGTILQGNTWSIQLEFKDYQPTPPRQRPATAQERDAQIRIANEVHAQEKSRRTRARLNAAKEAAEKAQTDYDQLLNESSK